MQTNPRPLGGVRILDFTRVLAGPYCTALLADMGAEVVKIESASGDEYRHVGPFVGTDSALFEGVNRGKKSVVMDFKDARDVAILKELSKTADIAVENFRPGVMDRLGLGASALRIDNERLIYASISGFGQNGPHASRPAYDIIVQAMSGIMAQTGQPLAEPTMVGEAIGDVAAGLFGAWGIMVALFDRERTGRGRVVDVSLFDALMAMMPTAAARVLIAGEEPVRTGNRHPLSAPFGVYPAQSGHFAVAVLNDLLFARFCGVLGRPELADDPRFGSDSRRRANEAELAVHIGIWSGTRTAAEVVAELGNAGIPASEIWTAHQAWTSDQAKARGLFSEVAGETGRVAPEQPVHFSGDSRAGRTRAPRLDEHGVEIRAEITERSNADL